MVETRFIPIWTARIAVTVLIESCEKAEQTALSTKEPQIRCIWTDGSPDDLGNVGAAVAWKEGTQWAGLKYRLARNKGVFDAELFALLRATIMVRDEVEALVNEEVQKITIFTDSQAAPNRIQNNGPGPGQIWASGIIRTTGEICRLNIQLEFRWVPAHADIEGNETADQLAKDAAAPHNEEGLPSDADRCTSLRHLPRCTTDAKWKRSDDRFEAKCKSKRYYHLDKQHKPHRTITKTEKSTAQIFYQLKVGHALIGPHLKRIEKAEDDKCWWCSREPPQSREHRFKHCKNWRILQNALCQAVKQASRRGFY
jgi:ribonuclease HI